MAEGMDGVVFSGCGKWEKQVTDYYWHSVKD